jgi:hypothetical protein
VVVVLASLGVAGRLGGRRKGPPALSHLESNTLVVADSEGRELWRKAFPHFLSTGVYAERASRGEDWAWFGDLDGDRGVETLFLYHPTSRDPAGTSLICFGEDGREKWRFSSGKAVSDRKGTYSRNYVISSFLVRDIAGTGSRQVLISSHHVSGHPNQFVLLSNKGEVQGEYWHSGHLPELNVADVDGDGRQEILLAGVNDGYRQATLIVLDPKRVSGASVQRSEDTSQLQGFAPAAEKARLLFPRSCINRKVDESNQVSGIHVSDGLIEAVVSEQNARPGSDMIYTFERSLHLTSTHPSEGWRRRHIKLESNRIIDHPLVDDEARGWGTPQVIRSIDSRVD